MAGRDVDLGGGRITPAARPVESFISPAQIQAAAPARPQGLVLSNSSPQLIQTAGRPNVPGYNPGEQLGEAMQRFGVSLTKTLGAGIELYGTHEYQQGQNEAMKAAMLVERQVEQSGADYAAANRDLARVDPIGAMAMDQTNPFRMAGRQSALSQVAAAELPGALNQVYRANANELAMLDPADPRVNEYKATAINSVVQKYRLDEASPGFARHVLPALNRGWEKFTAQQIQDRNDYLKSTIPRTQAVAGMGIYVDAMQNGIPVFNATGQVQKLMPGMPGFADAVGKKIGTALDQISNSAGLPGETMKFRADAIERLRVMAMTPGEQGGVRLQGLAEVIDRIPVPLDAAGNAQPAGAFFQQEKIDTEIKYGEHFRRQQDRQEADLLERYAGEVAQATMGLPDGPEKAAAIKAIDDKPEYQSLPVLGRLEAQQKSQNLSEDLTTRQFDPGEMANFLAGAQDRYGDAWDPKAAEDEFRQVLARTAPEKRQAAIDAWASLKAKKQTEAKNYPEHLLNPPIEAAIKANITAMYAKTPGQAALRKASVTEMMAWGDANVAESTRRQSVQYNRVVRSALAAKEAQLGRRLSEAEIISETAAAIKAFDGKKDSNEFETVFPGAGAVPSVGGRTSPGVGPKPTPPPGRQAQASPVYSSGGLDNMPNRQERLNNWRTQAVMSKGDALQEVQSVLSGGGLSAAVVRAAKDAKVDPATFVLTQLQAYPGAFEALPAKAREQFVRTVRNREGLRVSLSRPVQTTEEVASANPALRNGQGRSYLEIASNWLLNAVVPAAQAAEPNPAYRYLPGSQNTGGAAPGFGMLLGLLRSGEGGWDSANRGYAGDTPGGIPGLSKKTLGQWFEYQARGFHALGAYQFIPRTLQLAARELGLSTNTVMTPAVQDRLAVQLMVGSKRPRLAAYMKGKSNDLDAALDDLALEWASVATRGGGTAYPGQGGNAASITRQAARSALIRARQEYLGGGGGSPSASAGWQPARTVALTSRFNQRESFRSHNHEGVDVGFGSGSHLAFSMGGTVIQVQRTNSTSREAGGGYGTFMDVRLDNGQVVRMAHLAQIPRGLERGARFRPNQSIALSGGRPGAPGSGRSSGDHLHFEELQGEMGIQETTRGKLDPARRGGALSYLLWRRSS